MSMDGFAPLLTEPAGEDGVDDVLALVCGRPLLCLSDIHGDVDALESVLDAVARVELCGIVATGDHCLGGPDPFGVWQRLLALGAHCARGPSDLALGTLRVHNMAPRSAREEARLVTFLRTQQALGDIVCRRIAELPSTLVFSLEDTRGVMVMHGSPSDEYRGLQDDEHLEAEVGCVAEDALVCGSTHRSFARRVGENLLVVNAGSVGQSPVRGARGERTARAVLLAPCADGLPRAFARDIAVRRAARAAGKRAG
jgi:predicted phosphodiesterase